MDQIRKSELDICRALVQAMRKEAAKLDAKANDKLRRAQAIREKMDELDAPARRESQAACLALYKLAYQAQEQAVCAHGCAAELKH